MMVYGVIGVLVVIALILFPVVMEAIARKKNPMPKMNNDDKRFIEIKNTKTREMFECITR